MNDFFSGMGQKRQRGAGMDTVTASNRGLTRRMSLSMGFHDFEKRFAKLSDNNMTLEVKSI